MHLINTIILESCLQILNWRMPELKIQIISSLAGYVEEIYKTYLELKEMTPAPMNLILDKQPREEENEKRARTMKMTVEDVAPTSTPST